MSLTLQQLANSQCHSLVSMIKTLEVSIVLILVLKPHDLLFVGRAHHAFATHRTEIESNCDNFYRMVEVDPDLPPCNYH